MGQKSVQVQLYGVEMTSERLLNVSIEVLYPSPQKTFLATPLVSRPQNRRR